jgi:putative Mg2+ transporter-C (MgtC) family protein
VNPALEWLVGNWRMLLPVPWGHVVLTVVAVLCGAVVGSEREKNDKPAGLRTVILVCLGSAVFTMASYAFGTTTGDTGRVAAQIVTGIGFVGGGVILHGRTAVSGITTAATIWVAAALGIVVGVGYASAGLALSLLIRTVLSSGRWLEHCWLGGAEVTTVDLLLARDHGKTRFRLERLLEEHHVGASTASWSQEPGDAVRVCLRVHLPRRHRVELLDEIARIPEVREMRESSRSNPEAGGTMA